jgi:hypothetical protein
MNINALPVNNLMIKLREFSCMAAGKRKKSGFAAEIRIGGAKKASTISGPFSP